MPGCKSLKTPNARIAMAKSSLYRYKFSTHTYVMYIFIQPKWNTYSIGLLSIYFIFFTKILAIIHIFIYIFQFNTKRSTQFSIIWSLDEMAIQTRNIHTTTKPAGYNLCWLFSFRLSCFAQSSQQQTTFSAVHSLAVPLRESQHTIEIATNDTRWVQTNVRTAIYLFVLIVFNIYFFLCLHF